MGTKKTLAGRIGNLDLDAAFAEAELRSLAGRACEIWCQRDRLGRPLAYRVVTHREGRTAPEPWERLALFLAVGTRSKSKGLAAASDSVWRRRAG